MFLPGFDTRVHTIFNKKAKKHFDALRLK